MITDVTDVDEFKERLGVKCKAKTLVELIKYLDTQPEQSWNVNKIFRSLCISPRRTKIGYYEFEGEDKEPEKEDPARTKRFG